MRILSVIKRIWSGSGSLRSTLALYFIPISILPIVALSFYATHLYEESTREKLVYSARQAHKVFLEEVEAFERNLLRDSKKHANLYVIQRALEQADAQALGDVLEHVPGAELVRFYLSDGTRLFSGVEGEGPVPLLRAVVNQVKLKGRSVSRQLRNDVFFSIVRVPIRSVSGELLGILEEGRAFGETYLAKLKRQRQVDFVVLDDNYKIVTASFALSKKTLAFVSSLRSSHSETISQKPKFISLGNERFAAFLYGLPKSPQQVKTNGYVGVFLPMTEIDAIINKLKVAMVTSTLLLIVVASIFIIIFSNRLVEPIVLLVAAMKQAKRGRVEQIETLKSTDEIEYLVRSFNDMARNIGATKRALELKLQELQDANAAIKETHNQLVQSTKMASLGELVAGVAHELNNPIGFIYSNLQHLSDYVEKLRKLIIAYRDQSSSLPENERKKMEKLIADLDIDYILEDINRLTGSCQEGAERTKEIVLGLRNFSRMEEVHFALADLHEAIRNTLKFLASDLKVKVTLHEEYGELPQVECNISQLNQVFINLLSNAVQAIEGKGDIWIRTFEADGYAVIEVEDNGRGMCRESLEKIFDPFYTTKEVGQGTGLGLSIAYGIVQKHNGNITVRSKPQVGTCFTITLPIKQPTSFAERGAAK